MFNDPRRSGGVQQQRTLYEAKCVSCGAATKVPFEPTAERPVYCRDCYAVVRPVRKPRF